MNAVRLVHPDRARLRQSVREQAVLLLALVAAACGSSSTSPSGTTTSYSIFSITADPSVSASDQALVRDEMQTVALPYFAANFNWQPATPVQINMVRDGSPNNGGVASTAVNVITIYGGPNWASNTEPFKRDTVVHELFHVLQYSRGWNLGRTATWFVEGSAMYVSYRAALIDNGLLSADQVRACKERLVIVSQPPVPALSQLEGQQFYSLANQLVFTYPVAYVAVERAMQNVPITALPNAGATNSVAFADAFQSSFGTALTDFYANFEAYRQTWQPATQSFCGF